MEYNTQRPKMLIPEYGRHVQKMVDYAITVDDREERNKVALAIINVMGQLNPQLRDVEEYKPKLWAHLFIMSNFGLDVDCPYPKPSPESVGVKPERMPYPKNEIRYGHYGFIIQELIGKACELDEGDDKTAMVLAIANLMKKHFLTYNRLTANDQIIADQLATLSGGKLIFTNLDQLISTKEVMKSNGYQSNQQKRKPNYKKKKSNNFKRKKY